MPELETNTLNTAGEVGETSTNSGHADTITEENRVPVGAAATKVLETAARKLQQPNLFASIVRSVKGEPDPQLQDFPAARSVAGRFGHFTEGVRSPQSLTETRKERELERAYELITERAYHIFGQTEAFREAVEKHELGDALAETFDYITRIHTEGIREEKMPPVKIKGEVVDVRVAAEYMYLWVSNGKEHKRLMTAMQGLQASPDASFHPTSVDYADETPAEKLSPVKWWHPTEYTARELNTIVRAIRSVENRERGTKDISVVEHAKRRLSVLEGEGETVDPANRANLLAKNAKAKALVVEASYVGHEGDKEWKPQEKDEIAVTDQAAALGGMRRGFNTLLFHFKEGVHLNLEKDPIESLPILDGIDLRRGGATTEGHPAATRTSTRVEQLKDTTDEILQDMTTKEGRKKLTGQSGKALVKMGSNGATGINPLNFVPTTLTILGKGWNALKHLPGDAKAHRLRRKESAQALEQIARDLHDARDE